MSNPIPSKYRLLLGIFLTVIFVGAWQLWADSGKTESTTSAQEVTSEKLLKVMMPDTIPSIEKEYTGFTLSFNPQKHIPNWVAWELTDKETTGTVKRSNKFNNDPMVDGCPETYDYNFSGYQRGHMAPAGDMKWDKKAMDETFYLTNICPQLGTLNTGAWKNLEEKCRDWAQTFGSIFIVCGPVLTDNIREYIGDQRIAVPKRFFKVIIAPQARQGIGFVMNNGRVEGGMQKAAMSIDQVEEITGYDFFSELPDDLENEIEAQNNFHKWSTIRKSAK